MGGRQLDLWSIHFPFPTFKQQALMEALQEGYELGLARAVGVSNYSAAQLEEAAELLEQGRLAEGGGAREGDSERAEKLGQLLQVMQFIGAVNGGKTVAQVALGYAVAKGRVPIPE